ncbi:ParA family protein [Pannonibacter sp. Pt2]|uniref:ParA family protein n=1 Tax=Pannonibacter anstelovis TaxID=3121537 RepID=A0ABU7ZHZ5_9HYPH
MRKILIVNGKGGCGKTTLTTTLASAFAVRGERVFLADADRQRSSLGWLKRRPPTMQQIHGLDWSKGEHDMPSFSRGFIFIDGPGGLRGEKAKELVAEADDIVVPLMPSAFDWDATAAFLDRLTEMKRIRKGKAEILVVANRVRRSRADQLLLQQQAQEAGHPLLTEISDRVIYARHAANGSSVFDPPAAPADVLAQWHPLIQALD